MAFKGLIMGILVVAVFALLMVTFLTQWLNANNPNNDITNAPGLGEATSKVNNSINGLTNAVDSAKTNLVNNSGLSIQHLFVIADVFFWIPINLIGVIGNGIIAIGAILGFALPGAVVTMMLTILIAVVIISIVIAVIAWVRTGIGER